MNEEDSYEEPSYGNYSDQMKTPSSWKARFIVSLVIVLGSFIGLILSHIGNAYIWDYWRISIALFTLLSLWLCFYVRKTHPSHTILKVWQEVILWIPIYLAGSIFSLFVHAQTMNPFQASLALLISLSIVLFIAGILIEPSFIITSLSIALFSAGSAYLNTYLYKALLPIAALSILGIFLFSYLGKKR